jgi:hypothetical protein
VAHVLSQAKDVLLCNADSQLWMHWVQCLPPFGVKYFDVEKLPQNSLMSNNLIGTWAAG